MIKFLSIMLVLSVGVQASASDIDLKYFKKADLSIVGLGKKGYIHCERTANGVRLLRVGRDKVELNDQGQYVSRTDRNQLFVESKFKKSVGESEIKDQVYMDTDHIKNRYLRARNICDDHKALQGAAGLIRTKEPGDNDNDRDNDQQDAPSAPSAPSAP
ncbi:MAG: hypothetical protein K0R29_799, partial [Pseudobdellovibrio sp.]|nr:hypothetical protein [Pseudobdellovibrio sp.]